jgi:hypothetical protein
LSGALDRSPTPTDEIATRLLVSFDHQLGVLMTRSRRITIEVVYEYEDIVSTAYDARNLRRLVHDYVWHEGQADAWRLADHIETLTVTAQTTEDHTDGPAGEARA